MDERLAADPIAAAVSDEDAEEFFAIAFMLRTASVDLAERIRRCLGVRPMGSREKVHRRMVMFALRRWKEPQMRTWLNRLSRNILFNQYPDMTEGAEAWTDELFAKAYDDDVDIVWLVRIRRHIGKGENLAEWLNELSPYAEQHYRVKLDAGRLMVRRLVYPERDPARAHQEVAAAAQGALVAELGEKDRQSGALRKNLRRMQQNRRALMQKARQVEMAARSQLSQARGEVGAARKVLKEQLAAQERELAACERRFEAEAAGWRDRIAAAQAGFTHMLRRLPRVDALQGATVTVRGHLADREPCRLLAESLGGALAWESHVEPVRFAAFERSLRGQALERVHIKCDGLYRKKGRRPGIAVGGFELHLAGKIVRQHSAVVSCGAVANSQMAEYGALVMALSWLQAMELKPGATVEIWSDCKFVLNWLKKPAAPPPWRGCTQLDRRVRRLLAALQKRGCDVWLRWVPREFVETADRLCDRGYREQTWYHHAVGKAGYPLRTFLDAVGRCAY